jgi:hypothetical protein
MGDDATLKSDAHEKNMIPVVSSTPAEVSSPKNSSFTETLSSPRIPKREVSKFKPEWACGAQAANL